METIKKTKLEYCSGSSDKVYIVSVLKTEPDQESYKVQFRYGRWNNVNNVYSKPEGGVFSLNQALKLYYQQIEAKQKKGYEIVDVK